MLKENDKIKKEYSSCMGNGMVEFLGTFILRTLEHFRDWGTLALNVNTKLKWPYWYYDIA